MGDSVEKLKTKYKLRDHDRNNYKGFFNEKSEEKKLILWDL